MNMRNSQHKVEGVRDVGGTTPEMTIEGLGVENSLQGAHQHVEL